jgi:hypothetical protein
MRDRAPRPTFRCVMRKRTSSRSILDIARVVSLVAGFTIAGYLGAMISGDEIAFAKGGDGGSKGGSDGGSSGGKGAGDGGKGSGSGGSAGSGSSGSSTGNGGKGTGGTGTGGSGTGGTGVASGTGSTGIGGTGSGVGVGGTASGGSGKSTGTGATGSVGGTGLAGSAVAGTSSSGGGATPTGGSEERAGSADTGSTRGGNGFFARLMRSFRFGLFSPEPKPVASGPLIGMPSPNARRIGPPGDPALVRRAAPPRETQAFRFDVGTAVFPTTGGVLTTEQVDGVDLVTVDARHHRVIRPAAFFEPHEGARYDRRAVERFWPIEIGKRVRFVETVGNERWLHVMSAIRVETVSVPAGVFRAFVVERTMQQIGQGPRPVATYTYWYAPDAGAIVKTEVRPGDGERAITEEADVIGYPLSRPGTALTGSLE